MDKSKPGKKFGDVVRRLDSSNNVPIYHYGVYLGEHKATDQEMVCHLTRNPKTGKSVFDAVTLNFFKRGKECEFLRPRNKSERLLIEKRLFEVEDRIGQGTISHSILGGTKSTQCEETVMYITTGKHRSNQFLAEQATGFHQTNALASGLAALFMAFRGHRIAPNLYAQNSVSNLKQARKRYLREREYLDSITFEEL